MKLPSKRVVVPLATAAALATLIAHAAGVRLPTWAGLPSLSGASAAPVATAKPRPAPAAATAMARSAALPAAIHAAAAPTTDEVGDVDSFGRQLVWLGVTQGNVDLSSTCPPDDGDPTTNCVVLNPAPALTSFNLQDVAHVTLPGKSANSLLCYWFSPILALSYSNPTSGDGTGLLAYSPTLTVESEVLADPSLIDPGTGLPFDGKLTTGMTSSEHFEVPLAAGQSLFNRSRDSAVCIAGFLSRKTLVETFGLTDAQANKVFKKPMTIRLNLTGSTRYVDEASLMFGLRVVGDKP